MTQSSNRNIDTKKLDQINKWINELNHISDYLCETVDTDEKDEERETIETCEERETGEENDYEKEPDWDSLARGVTSLVNHLRAGTASDLITVTAGGDDGGKENEENSDNNLAQLARLGHLLDQESKI